MTYTVLDDIYPYSLKGATKMKQLDPFPYELIYPTTLIHYLLLLKFAENKRVTWCLLICKQIYILILLKSTIYIETACFYNGKISKEEKVVIKTLRLEKL